MLKNRLHYLNARVSISNMFLHFIVAEPKQSGKLDYK